MGLPSVSKSTSQDDCPPPSSWAYRVARSAESAHRVQSAITASGRAYPKRRVVVNLAPADLPKVGTAFDLPIAVGILVADGAVQGGRESGTVFIGELSLDGDLRPVNGALALTMAARKHGAKRIVLPEGSASEAAVVDGIRSWLHPRSSRSWAGSTAGSDSPRAVPPPLKPLGSPIDLSEYGVNEEPGALEIREYCRRTQSAAHWSPRLRKTMLASRLPTIFPGDP